MSRDIHGHAHWGFLVALAAIVAGFWPSFFRSLDGGSAWHTLHGVTATLWVLALALQSYLISRGLVRGHRVVAALALVLLAVFTVAALVMVAVMQNNQGMPPFLPPLLAFIDLPSLAFLLFLVAMALRNVRRPAIHKRYMSATIFLALPPSLGRLYPRLLEPHVDFMTGLHASFVTVDLILIALIVIDWRARQRHPPYPLSLAFFVLVQALMIPVSRTSVWLGFMDRYKGLAVTAG